MQSAAGPVAARRIAANGVAAHGILTLMTIPYVPGKNSTDGVGESLTLTAAVGSGHRCALRL